MTLPLEAAQQPHKITGLWCAFREDGFHSECSCGWISPPRDEEDARENAMTATRLGREHCESENSLGDGGS